MALLSFFIAVARLPTALGNLVGIFRKPYARFEYGQRFQDAMAGRSFANMIAAFENHADGRALLEALPDTQSLLDDRADLGRRPVGSFGRSYLDFLVTHAFDDTTYIEIAKRTGVGLNTDPQRMWLRIRSAAHDVRHVLTGYGADPLGEACLLAFRVGQLRHPGAAVLATITSIGCVFTYGPVATLRSVLEAYRRGCSALLVDLCPFEFNLSEPLESCRAKLGLTPPTAYQAALDRRSRIRQPAKGPA